MHAVPPTIHSSIDMNYGSIISTHTHTLKQLCFHIVKAAVCGTIGGFVQAVGLTLAEAEVMLARRCANFLCTFDFFVQKHQQCARC